MRHHVVRHTLFVLALAGLLLTLDAALTVGLSGSSISILVLGGIVFAYVLARLAHWVLRGSLRTRILAVFGINVLGLIPALMMLPVVLSWPDPATSRAGTRIIVFWLLAIIAWTTSVLATVAPIRLGPRRATATPRTASRAARVLTRA